MTATTTTSFFGELREATSELHQRTLEHPTVQGIGDGSLSDERFRYYIEQDYQYLLRFLVVLATAAADAPDLSTTANLSRLVASTIDLEIDGLRELYRRFGGDPARLDNVEPSPTCRAYTSYLLATAREGDIFLTLAAVLPCLWGYHDIGLTLKAAGLPEHEGYVAWIEDYASEEYGELVIWALGRFDELALEATELQKRRALEAWQLSSRYEILFWEMAWKLEQWPEIAI